MVQDLLKKHKMLWPVHNTHVFFLDKEIDSVPEDFKQNVLSEFVNIQAKIENKINVPLHPKKYFKNLKKLWKEYLTNIHHLDLIYGTADIFYPNKGELLSEFTELHYLLNLVLYKYTQKNKTLTERYLRSVPKEHAEAIMSHSSSVYSLLGVLWDRYKKKFGEVLNEHAIRAFVSQDSLAHTLYSSLFHSEELFKNLLKTSKNKGIPQWKKIEVPSRLPEYLRDVFNIVLYDNFVELLIRESRLTHMDIPFYFKLSSIAGRKGNVSEILRTLRNKSKNKRFVYNIPKFTQRGPHCGVAVFLNVGQLFGRLRATRKLEKEIANEVTVYPYPNNLPTSLVKVARRYGIPAKLLIDMDEYTEKVIKNPEFKDSPVLKKMLNELDEIPVENRKPLQFEEIIDILKNGGLVAYVTGRERILHYRLFYGYDIDPKGEKVLLSFDPLGATLGISRSKFDSEIRNRYGFWAIVYNSPDKVLERNLQERKAKVREVLKDIIGNDVLNHFIEILRGEQV